MKLVSGLAALALLAAPAAALAHAHAHETSPADKASVKSPKVVTIGFTEAVKPAFTAAELDGPDGKAIPTGKATFDAAKTGMTVPVKRALAPGAYTVKWHAVAVDTHRSEGRFGFTVEP